MGLMVGMQAQMMRRKSSALGSEEVSFRCSWIGGQSGWGHAVQADKSYVIPVLH